MTYEMYCSRSLVEIQCGHSDAHGSTRKIAPGAEAICESEVGTYRTCRTHACHVDMRLFNFTSYSLRKEDFALMKAALDTCVDYLVAGSIELCDTSPLPPTAV